MVDDLNPTEPENTATPETPETPVEPIAISHLKQNIRLDKAPITPRAGSIAPFGTRLNAAPYTAQEFNQVAANFPRLRLAEDAMGAEWVKTLKEGSELLFQGSSLLASLVRENSQWLQGVDNEGERINAGHPRFEANSDASNRLSGERAVIKVRSLLGLGAIAAIPLWHTGIWVQLKAPSNAALLELDRRITEEKVRLGRATSGMIFSNNTIYTTSYLVNFVLNHIYDCSLTDMSVDNLKATIKCTDLPTLVWGMLCTMYMNGYPLSQACIYNPAECQHVTNELIDIRKLSVTDNSALTKYQRKMMSRRTAKFSNEELKRYAEEHRYGQLHMVKFSDDLRIQLKVPSLAEYEQAGFDWVDGIEKMVEDSFGVRLGGNEREEYIQTQARLTAMRQYTQWVDRIVVGDEAQADVIEDRDTIGELLGELSGDLDINKQFFTEMGKYIDESTISLIALPKYNCPSCGKPQKSENDPTHEHLIPIDVVQVFFTLRDQRLFQVLTQSN